jgi:signal transduction histidine kinase/CheY-like chemotaxis protein
MERRTRADGLPSDRVFALHEDDEGRLWIGTSGGGLARLRERQLASFTRRDGLFDDVVFRILEDDDGGLWLSSNRGLSRVAKADLERFAAGQLQRIPSLAYGAADGMPSAECNGGSPAGTRARDGRLWFPTNRGLVGVDPRHIPTNTLPPPVLVESIEADGVRVSGPEPRLGPGVLRLEIQYAALSLLAPERVRFRYRLEGLDHDWVEAGTRRAAYYTQVPAGRYRFRVTACNNDGVWNEAGAELALTVVPRWQETGVFRLLFGALLLGCAVLGYRLRVRALTHRQAELQALVDERTARLREERAEADRQRAEADRQRERAEQASRAKSAFVAGMSHELRTPLNAVLGFVQLMERREGRDAEDRQHLGIINRSGEHLLGLINGVLSLSKIEAGLATLEEVPFDLRRLLEGLVEMFRPRAASRGLTLVAELDASLPRAVFGDEGKLRQIVINLLGNAFKFTEAGRVVLRARAAGDRVTIEVEDTGPGVAPEEQEGLFDAFTQAEAGRRSREGTGLGLALSRDHARLMRGDLAVSAAPGQGCLFRLEVALPAHQGDLPPRTPRIRQVTRLAPNQEPPRLLVVDDSPEERLLFGRLLGDVGYRVQEVASGEEALAAWRQARPDGLVLDLHLPGIDGLAVARTIRAREADESAAGQRRTRRTALVCVSASTLEGERERVLEAGGDAFLAKPFRDAALLGKLAELLGVRHVESAAAPREALVTASEALVEALRGQDAAWRERLRAAAAGGDSEALLAQVSGPGLRDPELATALEALVRGYRFDELEALLAAAEDLP